ncbi:MAG: cadherin-like domain-containing protein [Colwellia sp.]
MKIFISVMLCLTSISTFLVHSQELTFVQHDEWGSGRYFSVTKIKEHYYASTAFNRLVDVFDPTKTGSEALVAQLTLGTSHINQIEAYGEYLVVVANDGLSIYSINNITEITLEYFLPAQAISLYDDALYIGDKILFLDNNRLVSISDDDGEFSIDFVIDYDPEDSLSIGSRSTSMDDNYIYSFYQAKANNDSTENIYIDKYNRNDQTLVKQYLVADTSLQWLEKIANGQFIAHTDTGLMTLDVSGNEAITKVRVHDNGDRFTSRIVYNNNVVYAQTQMKLDSFTIDENLNIDEKLTYSFPQLAGLGVELKWLDNKIIHSDDSTGLLEFEISASIVNDSRNLYNQAGSLGRGVFLGENYYAPRSGRIDILSFNETKQAVKDSEYSQHVTDIFTFNDDFVSGSYARLTYNTWNNTQGWQSSSFTYEGTSLLTFDENYVYRVASGNSQNDEKGTSRFPLSTPLGLYETSESVSGPESASEFNCKGPGQSIALALLNKLLRFDTCAGLVHIYNSTEDDFSYIKSVPGTEIRSVQRTPAKGEYFYGADSAGIYVYTLTDGNELSETSFISRSNSDGVLDVQDDYLFVLTQFQMYVYDISNAESPRYISTVDYNDNYSAKPKVSLSGNKLALTFHGISRVRFYDLNRAPIIQETQLILEEDTTVDFTNNFTDIEGDQLSFELMSEPSKGTVNFDNGALYIPSENFYGADEFTVKVSDVHGNFIEQTLIVNVTSINDAPNINLKDFSVNEDESSVIALGAIDVEADKIEIIITQIPENGQASVNDSGELTYRGNDNFFGSDQLTLLLSDDQGGSRSIDITITIESVNDLPEIIVEEYTIAEDVSLSGQISATDIEQQDISFSIISGSVLNGEVSISSNGQFTFSPATDFNGIASFEVQAIDSEQGISQQTINIVVTEVDDIPMVEPISVTLAHSGSYSGELPVVDVDGDSMQYTIVTDVTNGTLTLSSNGAYSYSANSAFSGQDFFTFEVSDGINATESKVTFDVQAAPPIPSPITDNGSSSGGGSLNYFYLLLLLIIVCYRGKNNLISLRYI